MNEQHVQHVLNLWGKTKGKTVSKAIPFWRHKERELLKVSPLYSIFYKETKGHDPEMVAIDYPFCHGVIKGLEDFKQALFLDALVGLLGYSKAYNHAKIIVAVQCATVDQILEALWKIGHE